MGSPWLSPMHIPSQSLQPHLDVVLSFRSKLLILLNSPESTLSELKRLMKVGLPANLTGIGKAEEIHRKPFGSLPRGAQACSQNIREGRSAPPPADICTALGPSLKPPLAPLLLSAIQLCLGTALVTLALGKRSWLVMMSRQGDFWGPYPSIGEGRGLRSRHPPAIARGGGTSQPAP